MSSVVNKSGIRFAPKAKQRRSTTGTPVPSRRPSVTPNPDSLRRSIDASYQESKDKDAENDNGDSSSDDEDDAASKTSTIEMPKPQETRPRRLSTLNNLSNRDVFRKVSVQGGYSHDPSVSNATERKTHIIGIPQPPTAAPKRRRSTVCQSRRGSVAKRQSISEKSGKVSASATPSVSVAGSVPPPSTVPEQTNEDDEIDENDPKSTIRAETQKDTQDSQTDLSSQAVPSSSIPIPSTQPSSVPSTAPTTKDLDSTVPEEDEEKEEETGTKDDERPTTAPEASSTKSPIGIPLSRPSTAPVSSKALAKAPETSASPPSTDLEPGYSILDPKDGSMTFTEGSVSKAPKIQEPLITNYKIRDYRELPKSIDLTESVKYSVDEAHFTIADLCRPTVKIGKHSANFELATKAHSNRLKQRRHQRELRQRAKQEKMSIEEIEKLENSKIKTEFKDEDGKDGEDGDKIPDVKPPAPQAKDVKPSQAANAIQLKVGLDGNIVVDEESRVLDRHANLGEDNRERYNENPFENVVNSATYGRQRYTDKWESAEIESFYRALGTWGTDFGLIAQMFPHRTRRQVKAKFILEEKKRPRIIELALNNKLNGDFDFDKYCSDSNKTFGTLNDFNAKLEQLKKDHEENLKELSIAKEKAKEEDAIRQKKREEEVKANGGNYNSRPLTRQERMLELRKHETVLGSIDDVKKQREEEEQAE